MSLTNRVGVFALVALLLPFSGATAQKDFTAFSIYIENDAPLNSDTGYTNGLRLSWAIMRNRPWMQGFVDRSLPGLMDRAMGVHLFGVRWLTLDPLRLSRLGLIPDKIESKACSPSSQRAEREIGACTIHTLGIAQTMYTPDSLASTRVQPRDQPYSGFLFGTIGVTTLDAPSMRNSKSWIGYTEVSHQLILGVTGTPAGAEVTQSLAHWTWSPASKRPLGWGNQLKFAPHVGLLSDIAFRPKRFFEYCANMCDGSIDEQRIFDVTPHTELVASTHMVRVSAGATARLGFGFPDMVGTLRIPVAAPAHKARSECFLYLVCQRYWAYAFVNADARYVPHNMFLAGGYADGGPSGWKEVREIDPRTSVNEYAVGFAFGNKRMTFRGQHAYRTPEYDVRGAKKPEALHGFASFMLSIHPPTE